ncbi:hypothetical protein FisN_10Lh207 [Fistulifera solaris]|uniref:Trafficking protein particle complex subunit n=1 Tax=Fistulifera solaris TaxID=1519565 RepID=A0A1Z5JUA6_FISSO|nr:hypothetical protein FisN_10Lh207 [Fistulifera solaris]|eukprot:GAX17341.1 hypothetical protein FisN_10Lh207 [Fistulifera solaris]
MSQFLSNSTILDRPVGRSQRSAEQNVSLSAFSYLFSEMVQYHQNRVDSVSALEHRLEAAGYGVGLKVLELLAYRARDYTRQTKLMNMLQFVSTTAWKALFGKAADSLEKSIDHADEFMIVDYAPITSTSVSVPADLGGLSVDAYISGIIAGMLQGAGFPARVTAHTVEEGDRKKAVFLVKFSASVMSRDATIIG